MSKENSITLNSVSTLIIGGGPAGLATSQQLLERGIENLILEKGDSVGHAWTKQYDSLRLHTGKHLSNLPGLSFDADTPLFPHRDDFVQYLRRYLEVFDLPLRTGVCVTDVDHRDDGWVVKRSDDTWKARHLVVATGIMSNPNVPEFPGMEGYKGNVFHSVEYDNPEGYENKSVLVIGLGNSSGEIAPELANAGADVTVSARTGTVNLPVRMAGIPVQYLGWILEHLPEPCRRFFVRFGGRLGELIRGPSPIPNPDDPADDPCLDVPLIGLQLREAIETNGVTLKREIERFWEHGVEFGDGTSPEFDHVILATGYDATLGFMGELVSVDQCGFAARTNRVVSTDQPNLYFVGHNYGPTGGLHNINRDSRKTAQLIAENDVS